MSNNPYSDLPEETTPEGAITIYGVPVTGTYRDTIDLHTDDPIIQKALKEPVTWCSKLYPWRVFVLYWLVKHSEFVTLAMVTDGQNPEQLTDYLITEFMEPLDFDKYCIDLSSALHEDNIAKRIMLYRILWGSFQGGVSALDKVRTKYRDIAIGILSLNGDISEDAVIDRLNEVIRGASAESMIIGRLGYLAAWRDLAPVGFGKMIE